MTKKRRGRPPKNLSKISTSTNIVEQKYSLDPETINYLDGLQYMIWRTIVDTMKAKTENPLCMPISFARKIVKDLKLDQYEPSMEVTK